MSAPQISGFRHTDILAAVGVALLQVKNAKGLKLPDMASVLRKSDDQLARYIAGDMEMGAAAWLLAVEEWPDLPDKVAEQLKLNGGGK